MTMRFDYVAPETVDEALALLRRHGEDAKVIAGGQSLLILLREGAVQPRCVVGLERIPALSGIDDGDADVMTVGAMATYRMVYRNRLARQRAGLLARACESIGPLPIHAAGTIGGNVCHNAPGADPPPALLALDAHAVLAGPAGTRTVPLAEFFLGMFETAAGPDEILTAIRVPSLPTDARWTYLKFSPRAMDMAIASVAVVVRLGDDGVCREARVAIGGAAPVPYRARGAEHALLGRRPTGAVLAEAGAGAAEDVEFITDFHASAAYRCRVLPVLVRRAVEAAIDGTADGGDAPRSGEGR